MSDPVLEQLKAIWWSKAEQERPECIPRRPIPNQIWCYNPAPSFSLAAAHAHACSQKYVAELVRGQSLAAQRLRHRRFVG